MANASVDQREEIERVGKHTARPRDLGQAGSAGAV